MVNIFAREITDNLASLVKEVDSAVEKNKDLASFVVLLAADPDAAEKTLKEFATKHSIKNVPLTVFEGIAGPPNYKIAEGVDVTVTLWSSQNVKASHAFRKAAGLDAASVKKVIADTAKILE